MPQLPSEETLRELKGSSVPVHKLLALFDTRVRNDQTVLAITEALKSVGLSTIPYFATCNSRVDVLIVALESAVVAEPEVQESETEELAPGMLPQHSFRIGDIPAAKSGVESVPPSASLATATHLMSAKGYSQLPVIEGRSDLRGVITWQSVAMMYGKGLQPSLTNAMVLDPPVSETHGDFFSQLSMISEHGYLLVRKNDGQFTGIVTAADVTERFDATAWPFFTVGEIEYRLRKCLGAKIGEEAIKAVQLGKLEDRSGQISDLMFNGYVKLLNGDQKNSDLRAKADQNWQALGWAWVDRVQFVYQLDRVRQIRNKIAHFDTDPLSSGLKEELRQFVGLLRQLT
jgi:hypothetical protein